MAQEKAVEQAAAANPGANGAERWGQAAQGRSRRQQQFGGAKGRS